MEIVAIWTAQVVMLSALTLKPLKKILFSPVAPLRRKSKLPAFHSLSLSTHLVLPGTELSLSTSESLIISTPYPFSFSVNPSKISHSSSTSRPSKDKPYHCLEAGCDGRFTRPFDLSRHLKTTHLSGRRIDCPEGWCGRAGQPERGEKGGFTRVDHFYEHVKKVHRKEVIKDSNGNMFVKNSDGRLSEARWTNPSKSHR